MTYLALPSTSPAHASLDLAAKLAAWQALRESLRIE
jgi:G:T/U-mismatch repair DNA glycosylase